MRAITVLFDTLNLRYLECYGGSLMETPNFRRLAEHTVTFDNHHVGSLPCMPARRDMMTGRLNFMHRSWGPLEPFDVTFPKVMAEQGVYSHMVTDHYHYWEVGGAGYLNAYSSFEILRGQEGDQWKGVVAPPLDEWRKAYHPAQYGEAAGDIRRHNITNRGYIRDEGEFPSTRCFDLGLEFIDTNKGADDWFLQIETFDPHEPFHAPDRHRDAFPRDWSGGVRDWPPYDRLGDDADEADELRRNYMALLAHCDAQLGRLLDRMDALDLWKDTMLIVTTDHGYLMGEHDWWAKNRMPAYREIEHIPLFIHHPGRAQKAGTRADALTQTIDLMPTLLDAFDCPVPDAVRGQSLLPVLDDPDTKLHEAVIFGYFGGAINVTDGRHTYFRYPENFLEQAFYQYTLLPSHMLQHFVSEEMQGAELIRDLGYAAGYPVLRIPVSPKSPWYASHGPAAMEQTGSLLFDILTDPEQAQPLDALSVTNRMERLLSDAMAHHDAPPEAFARLALTQP